ncbi:MAG: GNAT family N-acetyltransferase [Candidatus Bathyarchaeota archaeon]
MQIKVRGFEDRDFSDYVSVLEKTWPLSHGDAEETIRERLKTLSKKGEQIWTTEIDGKGVGFMLIYFENPPSPPELELEGEWLVIDWLDVHPDFQRRSSGTLLLKKAEQIAQSRNVFSIYTVTAVDNKKMLSFSRKNGFRVTKRTKDFWGIETGDAFLLTKTVET